MRFAEQPGTVAAFGSSEAGVAAAEHPRLRLCVGVRNWCPVCRRERPEGDGCCGIPFPPLSEAQQDEAGLIRPPERERLVDLELRRVKERRRAKRIARLLECRRVAAVHHVLQRSQVGSSRQDYLRFFKRGCLAAVHHALQRGSVALPSEDATGLLERGRFPTVDKRLQRRRVAFSR